VSAATKQAVTFDVPASPVDAAGPHGTLRPDIHQYKCGTKLLMLVVMGVTDSRTPIPPPSLPLHGQRPGWLGHVATENQNDPANHRLFRPNRHLTFGSAFFQSDIGKFSDGGLLDRHRRPPGGNSIAACFHGWSV
jgi:hypothetical protein